ncbi:PREDICTED: toll-like receptor 3 [Bactrocera latifrons]|uniref:toll-like receptor 3 n=1 Tax=Bactrocera latifrons TaxID=174628 RepID=UPI0008DDCEE1|nr:PREDICTED: toll-like receptor 3 [Bactrocera latifrons]XP_018785406.1 PREDICTED: toll-like receptor 3 [Bactrocera latifrons]
MSFALKLALVLLLIHFKLHGLNAATIVYRYKTIISDNGSSSSDNNNTNNASNFSKNNYMLFNGNNNTNNVIIEDTILYATTTTLPTTTNTTYDWQISDKYLLLPHATNSSDNVSKNNNNDTLSVQQLKVLCDNNGENSNNSCGNGRDVLSDDTNLKQEIANLKQISNIDNNNNNSNELANASPVHFVTAEAVVGAQEITTNMTNSLPTAQVQTSNAKSYYQYDLTADVGSNTTAQILFADENAEMLEDLSITSITQTTTELPSTDEPFEPNVLHGLFRGWDNIVTAHDLVIFLRKYRSELNKTCVMDGVKVLFQWWSFQNGSLNFATLQERLIVESKVSSKRNMGMDLSYHDLNNDDKLYTQTLEKQLRIGRNVIVFSASHNNLTQIPFRTLSTINSTLQYLTLKGNNFNSYTQPTPAHEMFDATDLNGTAAMLAGIPPFTYRDFIKGIESKKKNQDKNRIAWATFPYMPLLIELDISSCNIEIIDRDVFRNITGIHRLFMSRNKMLSIPKNTFQLLSKLEYLDLSYTNLLELDSKMPTPTLDAIWNLLHGVHIQAGTFKGLKKLRFLDMSHTKITCNSAVSFAQLGPELELMSLCFTAFPLFDNSLFKNTRLMALDLSGNPHAAFNCIDDAFESIADTLEYLFFEYSNLKDLYWLKYLKRLRVLSLSNNNINTLTSDYFGSLENLELIDLAYNNIGNWYEPAFGNNTKLRVLNLRNNNINILNYAMLNDFKTLELLGLSKNNFACDCLLSDLMALAVLNNKMVECAGNVSDDNSNIILANSANNTNHTEDNAKNNVIELKTLLSAVLKNLPQKPSKRSYGNLHNYYLRRSATRLLTITPKAYLRLTYKASDNECDTLNSVKYTSDLWNGSMPRFRLIDYEDDDYWCFNGTQRMQFEQLCCEMTPLDSIIEDDIQKLRIIVIVSVCSLLGLSLLIALLYMKRWHIYYYYSSLKSAALMSMATKDQVNKFNELAESDPHMVYDIFISYCQSDRDWVLEELLPNVEETDNISICLHERDFQIGVAVLENIISCMDRSRALMLIVSSNFLLSHWCQFEMHLAQHRIFEVGKEHLIVVFLEDIPRSKRPKTLQYLMEVKTYIKWPGAKGREVKPEERKQFWKRLRRSLEHIGIAPAESHA